MVITGLFLVLAISLFTSSLTIAAPFEQRITPSNDITGTTDWQNLQTAFNAASGIPGAVIELQAGTYYINQAVVIKDFVGTFKGAGMEQTIVQTPGGDYLFPKVTEGPVWEAPGMFIFYYDQLGEAHTPARLTLSDMTWHAIGQTEGWVTHVPFLVDQFAYISAVYGRYTGIEDDEVSYISTTAERMQFLGDSYPEGKLGPVNVINGFIMEPEFFATDDDPPEFYTDKQLCGSYTCISSKFQNILYAYNTLMITDSSVTVGGKPQFQNTFIDCATGVDLFNLDNSEAEVSYSETFNSSAVIIELYAPGLTPSTFTIKHNTIRQRPSAWFAGVEVWSYGLYYGQENIDTLNITQNTIISESHNPPYGPIFCFGAHNTNITNNMIQGTGESGIFLGGLSTGCYIRGNNLKHYDATAQDIYLGPATSHCTVILGATDTITDDGTNNTIQG